MKTILIPIAFLILSCGTNKSTSDLTRKHEIESPCPDNGNCSFEILQNKSIEMKIDGIGKMYYELADNPEKSVYLYKYSNKIEDPTLQDAGYREEILFEIYNKTADFSFSGTQLQSTKMIFGVFCFCRGKAGYYKVNEGKILKQNNTLSVEIPAIVSNQKTTRFNIK